MPADADFDGSGLVDVHDFLQFIASYGSQVGQNGYQAKFDLDSNGVVNIADFLLFVGRVWSNGTGN